jgi:DNA-binding FadR family transcriptional regulator
VAGGVTHVPRLVERRVVAATPGAKASAIPARGKAAWIAAAVRDDIVAGRLRPGDALPPESVLMSEYQVSQPTMRAALRILENDGLVRIQWGPGGGPRVQELDVDVLAQRAQMYLEIEGANIIDLMEALIIIQPGAVTLAAARATDEQIAALRACAERVPRCKTMVEFGEVAADFVVILLEASGNRTIKLFALVIRALVHETIQKTLVDEHDTSLLPWHAQRFGEVVNLITEGHGEAAAALWRAHMLATIPEESTRAITGRREPTRRV